MLLVARLFDVAADGAATEITTGSMLGSQSVLDEAMTWRGADEAAIWPWPKLDRDIYLTSGHKQRFDIALNMRMWDIQPGHHMRLELATAAPDGACGKDAAKAFLRTKNMYPCRLNAPQQRTVPGGVYTIIYGAASVLRLPLIDTNSLKAVREGQVPTSYDEGSRRLTKPKQTLPLDGVTVPV